ncbi:unnamed protein product [Didymodactylos carnosus]|uniref:Uncharacterized protein n=2 Tax=Didymodactylos carnosus TaxID=1234261 RepID=A0A8S2RC04_9BILA|nr:unnamed protein product [Didymodactylos carnosus]CAF4151048.1 unnamed protein product [Didymodactylos carnosus]
MEKDVLFRFFINEIDYNRMNNPKCLNNIGCLNLHCSSPITYSKLSTILTTYYRNVRSLEINDLELIDNNDSNSSAMITRTITLNNVKFVDLSYSSNQTWKNFHKILRLMPNINSLSIRASNFRVSTSDLFDSLAVLCDTPAFCNKIICLQLTFKFIKVNLSQVFIYFDKLERLRLYFFRYGYDDDDDYTTTKLEYDENDLSLFCFKLIKSKTLLSVDITIYNTEMILTLYNKLINFRNHSTVSSAIIEIVHNVCLTVRKWN